MERSRKRSRRRGLRIRPVLLAAAVTTAALALAGAASGATPLLTLGDLGLGRIGTPTTGAGGSFGATTVGVGPGAGIVVCHVEGEADVLGTPLLVQLSDLGAFLLANPDDYAGACGSNGSGSGPNDGSNSGSNGPNGGPGAPGIASNGAGQSGSGAGLRVANATAANAVAASAVPCGESLLVRDVKIAPLVIRQVASPLLVRLRVLTERGEPVQNAIVTLRSTPRGKILKSLVQRTDADGSVLFMATTTKQLRLVRGGRLLLFARATRPGQPLVGCTTGRRLLSVRTGIPAS